MPAESRSGLTKTDRAILCAIGAALGGLQHYAPPADMGRILTKLDDQAVQISTLFSAASNTTREVAKIQTAIAVINNNRESDRNVLTDHEARLRSGGR